MNISYFKRQWNNMLYHGQALLDNIQRTSFLLVVATMLILVLFVVGVADETTDLRLSMIDGFLVDLTANVAAAILMCWVPWRLLRWYVTVDFAQAVRASAMNVRLSLTQPTPYLTGVTQTAHGSRAPPGR